MSTFLSFVFVPVYLRAHIFTTPEYIEKRFSSHIRTYLAILSLSMYVFTKISVAIFAACVVFETVLGWNQWIGATVLLSATGLYTILGGFRAVVQTEVIQSIVLLLGATVLMVLTVVRVGSLSTVYQAMPDKFHIFKSVSDSEFPWPGVLTTIPLNGLWYWCTDQGLWNKKKQNYQLKRMITVCVVIVQRVLCAKNARSAQGGCVFAGYLKLTPTFMLVIPGIVASYMFPDEVSQDSNKAFTLLVTRLMPVALKGLIISAMLSAAMSTLSSVFNSASTLFTMDIYSRIRTNASERELVIVGRVASLLVIAISVIWMPIIQMFSDQLFVYVQAGLFSKKTTSVTIMYVVSAYLTPPIGAMFVAGIFCKRVTTAAAVACMIVGSALGIIRLVMEMIVKSTPRVTENWVILLFARMHYLYFGALLYAVCAAVLLVVTLITTAPRPEQTENCTIDWSYLLKLIKRQEPPQSQCAQSNIIDGEEMDSISSLSNQEAPQGEGLLVRDVQQCTPSIEGTSNRKPETITPQEQSNNEIITAEASGMNDKEDQQKVSGKKNLLQRICFSDLLIYVLAAINVALFTGITLYFA